MAFLQIRKCEIVFIYFRIACYVRRRAILHNLFIYQQCIRRRHRQHNPLSRGTSSITKAEKIEFNISLTKNGESKLIYVYFFDLLTKRARAFKLLKETTEKGRKALGIVCGGDGTIIWVVS